MNVNKSIDVPSCPHGADRGSTWAVAILVVAEVVMALAFALNLLTGEVLDIESKYLRPHLQSYQFNEKRQQDEVTYYSRHCGPEDVSTVSSSDLWMTTNKNESVTQQHAHHAYDTFLRHGAVVFPDVLSRDTAAKLRQFIISKNLAQTPGESEFLHSPKHRWVVELGFDEHPIVATALEEISTHPLFRASLAKIFGSPDAALIEFDAITSEYGCQNQSWHTDGVEDRSPLLYARSFAPTHLMLTPLQDTTPEMGGTALCPGTHYCRSISDAACTGSYQIDALTHPNHTYWPTGHGLMLTTNTYHRGTAFVDPDASDKYRVVLVTTFSPIPQKRDETRQLSHGLSFSLKWYMWGHTLNDFVRGGMARPWADWTALGLYKRSGNTWGYDFVTGFLQRMHGGDCCTLSNDALHEFVEKGGPRWLPRFLHAQYSLEASEENEPTWYEYIFETIRRCHDFVRQLHNTAVFVYLPTMFAFLVNNSPRVVKSITRVLLAHAILWALAHMTRETILSNAAWTRDIRGGAKDVVAFPFQPSVYTGAAAVPTSHDVLIGSRLDSKHLGMYSDFLRYHPANRKWYDAIRSRLAWAQNHFHQGSLLGQEELAKGIVQEMLQTKSARFLYQVPSSGKWIALDTAAAVTLTAQELFVHSQPLLHFMSRELRFLRSVCVYGSGRDTKLCKLEPHLVRNLANQWLHVRSPSEETRYTVQATSPARLDRGLVLPRRFCEPYSSTSYATNGAASSTMRASQDSIPHSLSPLEGDVVHVLVGATTDDDTGGLVPAWWIGNVVSAHPLGVFHVRFEDTGAVEQFAPSFVCLSQDGICMDNAELYDGWSKSENGTYVNANEFLDAPDDDDNDDDDENEVDSNEGSDKIEE